MLVMCVVSVLMRATLDSCGLAASLGRAWFIKPKHNRLLGHLSGAVLIGGGIWLSLMRRRARNDEITPRQHYALMIAPA